MLWLPPDTVHVWRIDLDRSPTEVKQLATTLSMDESQRAARFHFEHDRQRFIVSRGILRTILAMYSSAHPREIEFCYGARGKPMLAPAANEGCLQFNLSHSHSLALVAVSRDRELGVDLEWIRPVQDILVIAERFFSPYERFVLHSLPREQQQRAFFTCWTRKEAYIKARGGGLSLPLDEFDVSLAPDEPAALLSVRSDPDEAARWSLRTLEVLPAYAASLVVEGHDWQLIYCE